MTFIIIKISHRLMITTVATILTGAVAYATPVYNLTDLGVLAKTYSVGLDINDNRQVTGASTTNSGYEHTFIWDAANGYTDLGTLGGARSYGFGINNSGQVTGWSETDSSSPHFAYIGDAVNGLSTLGGFVSEGSAINDSGQVTGLNGNHAFISNAFSNSLTDLGFFPGGDSSQGVDINNNGQVTGWASIQGGGRGAFISDGTPNSLTNLGTLGGVGSSGLGINNSGQVTGVAYTNSGYQHAFISDPTTNALTDLGSLGATTSIGLDINDSGQVVGTSRIDNGQSNVFLSHAFLWDNGTMYDLNNLINPNDPLFGSVTLFDARGINSFGDIIANGVFLNGQKRAILLTTQRSSSTNVPEPAPLGLLGLGLLSIGFMRKYRSNLNQRFL